MQSWWAACCILSISCGLASDLRAYREAPLPVGEDAGPRAFEDGALTRVGPDAAPASDAGCGLGCTPPTDAAQALDPFDAAMRELPPEPVPTTKPVGGPDAEAGVEAEAGAVTPRHEPRVFDFEEASGTSLEDVDPRFRQLGSPHIDYEVEAGKLRAKAGRARNQGSHALMAQHGSDQTSRARIAMGFGASGEVILFIHGGEDASYFATVQSTRVQLRRRSGGDSEFLGQVDHGLDLGAASGVFALRREGRRISVLAEGQALLTFDDASPLEGGHPGFALAAASGVVTEAQLEAWSDDPDAAL